MIEEAGLAKRVEKLKQPYSTFVCVAGVAASLHFLLDSSRSNSKTKKKKRAEALAVCHGGNFFFFEPNPLRHFCIREHFMFCRAGEKWRAWLRAPELHSCDGPMDRACQ